MACVGLLPAQNNVIYMAWLPVVLQPPEVWWNEEPILWTVMAAMGCQD